MRRRASKTRVAWKARLLQLLEKGSHQVKDLLEVERELARVREQVELFEGKQRLFDSQVELATLLLQLTTRETFQAGQPLTMSAEMSLSFFESGQALVATGRQLALLIAALAPWLPIFLLLGFAGRNTHGWRSARRLTRAQKVTMAP
jgi:hypothetical protein